LVDVWQVIQAHCLAQLSLQLCRHRGRGAGPAKMKGRHAWMDAWMGAPAAGSLARP
jgi:hypothetical protein